jgi:hypothetical protein
MLNARLQCKHESQRITVEVFMLLLVIMLAEVMLLKLVVFWLWRRIKRNEGLLNKSSRRKKSSQLQN